MKRIATIILLTGMLNQVNAQETGIHFENGSNWGQILKKAKAEHKYIFVDCYATWCGPCKVMDEKVYPDKEVGEVYNKDFISVKLQMDQTANDDEPTKNSYGLAKSFSKDYSVNAYPTFLFFDADGNPLHKVSATRPVQGFIQLASEAKDPNKQYYMLVKNFEPGKLDTAEEKGLATLFSYSDPVLAGKIALDYITRIPKKAWKDSANMVFMGTFNKDSIIKEKVKKYISHLSDKEICANTTSVYFTCYFTDDPTDRGFTVFYHHADEVDNVAKKKGLSASMVNHCIFNQELAPVILSSKKNNKEPNWDSISNNISKRFDKEYIVKNIANGKIKWYQYKEDWENYCANIIVKLESDPDLSKDLNDSSSKIGSLNSAAWEIFGKSNDKVKLGTALHWAELITDATTAKYGYASNITDTRANLLYKLGRKDEAIVWEEKALKLRPGNKGLLEILQKMKEDKPTW